MSLQGDVLVHLKTSINISPIETLFIIYRMYEDELKQYLKITVMLVDLFQHHNSILVLKLY
jgi:hypothetical protein